jgi:hypothetical protein
MKSKDLYLILKDEGRREIIQMLSEGPQTEAGILEKKPQGIRGKSAVQNKLQELRRAGLIKTWDAKNGHILDKEPLRDAFATIGQMILGTKFKEAFALLADPVNRRIIEELADDAQGEDEIRDTLEDEFPFALLNEEPYTPITPIIAVDGEPIISIIAKRSRLRTKNNSVGDRLLSLRRAGMVEENVMEKAQPSMKKEKIWTLNKQLLARIFLYLVSDSAVENEMTEENDSVQDDD